MEVKSINLNAEYAKRINRVLDYLDVNYSEKLTLETLAEVANFSPYHFHRIFKGIVGESLYKYIQRIRIEKAAKSLKYDNKSITEIALDCGFTNSASFSRTFKEYFSMSATEWRKSGSSTFSKNCKEQSNKWQGVAVSPMYIDSVTSNSNWRLTMSNKSDVTVEVKNLSEIPVAYIRHIGPFKGQVETWQKLFQRLMKWASAKNLIKCPGTMYFTIFRDDLKITEFSKFKADVCISVEAGTTGSGDIGISVIPAGKYAVAQFEIDGSEFEQAWDSVYSNWLPESGYQPDDRCCFERYLNDPNTHPTNKHVIEVCIPVKPI